jgi:hypothetical protein
VPSRTLVSSGSALAVKLGGGWRWTPLGDARDGDPALYRQRLEELVDLHFRLVAEQRAEEGYLPTTVEGCIAVLSVAERILRVVGGRDAPWSGTDERRQR